MAIDFSYSPQQASDSEVDFSYSPEEAKPKKQNKGLVADIGTDLKRGVQNIPSAITGLADIPVAAVTGSPLISAAAEGLGKMTGFQPGQWAKEAEQEYSEGRKQARQNIDAAWKDGTAGDIASAYLQNPSQIVGSIAESLPSMLVGGLAGRAALGIGGRAVSAGAGGVGPALPGAIARTVGEKLAPAVGAGLGEGAVMAGQAMDNLTEQGVDPRTAAGYAAGTGLVGAALGAGGGKVAQMLGVVDPETAIAGGAARAIREGATATKWQAAKETGKNIIGGGISEGIFEELPQSVMEQAFSNLAQDKPIGEGVARAGVEGALAGFGMGAGFNAIPARQEPQGPLSRTVEAGKQSGAIQETPLALGYNANVRTDGAPLYTYPDGSTLTQAEYEKRQAAEEKQRLDGMIQDAPLTRMAERAQERAAETAPDRDLANLIAEEKNRLDPVRAGLASVALERQQARQEKQSARSQQGDGSFSTMNEFADLLNSERQKVESSRRAIAAKQALRRESDLESADARVADSMAKESEQKRRNVLESVLSDPSVKNHAAKFSAELKRQGFRNVAPTESELSSISRFGDILNAKPETTTEPSLPNEATAEQLGIKERKEPSQAQGSQRDKIAEVQQLVSAGWKVNGRTLVSPTGKKRNLNFAERYAAVKAQQENRGDAAQAQPLAQEATQANDAQAGTQPAAAQEAEGVAADNTPVKIVNESRGPAPIAKRDDLVGAIMRVTGGKGIAANQAQTIVGDKANAATKVRGLFTNDGIADLDDTAELLRTEEGYDVRDGNHLAELVSEQAAGNAVYSMERTEREAADNAEKEYKASVNQKAEELGLKKVGGKRTLAMVEADIAAKEKEISEQEAREERASIQASEIAEDIYQEGSELTEADLMQWLGDRIEYSQDEINEANSRASERESRRVEKNAGDDSQEQAQGSSPEGAGTGATEAGARSTESLTEPTDDLISRAKSLGMKTVGVSAERLTKQVEEAESFNLSKQTNEQAAAEYKRQQEEANKKDEEPAPNVTADQVDMWNTQGSLIDSNRDAKAEAKPAIDLNKSNAANILRAEAKNQISTAGAEAFANGKERTPPAFLTGERRDMWLDGYDKAKQDASNSETTPALSAADSVISQAESIEDFGEKLEGARKDRTPSLSKELSDDDIATQPLSKIWPAAEIDAIENTFAAAVAFAARNEIPAKPRKSYLVARWVEKVKMLRGLASKIVNIGEDKAREIWSKAISSSDFKAKVALLESIDRDQWERIGTVSEYPNAYRYGENGEQIKSPIVRVEVDGKGHNFDDATSVADVIEKVNGLLGIEKQAKKMQFEVRGRGDRYFINKKGDKEYRKLKEFTNTKDAFAFIKDNYDDLVAAWDGVKDRDNVTKADVRNVENRPRTGSDWRNGKDVTAEQFQDAFGFRGGQFGKWVTQGNSAKERQWMLNQAYDALMDLASIVGIPPKAISLNGSLGLAFGARGSGNAAAHFEPDTLVINLTKTKGAGSLAHEWFHALDNYFSRQRGGEVKIKAGLNAQQAYRTQNFITYRPEPMMVHKTRQSTPITRAKLMEYHTKNQSSEYYNPENWHVDPKHPAGVRPEVERAFAELVEALDASPMKSRAAMNDKSADGYWSRIIERGARAFENFVIFKMMENGYNNDYLANVRNVQDFPRAKERYPYLLPEEVAPIAEAFDNLFSTIKTKETDNGVVMYSKSQGSVSATMQQSQAEQRIKALLGDKVGRLLIESGVISFVNRGNEYQGATYTNGTIALNLDALSADNFDGVLLHEGFHSTIRQLVGEETYAKLMKQLENMLAMGRGAQWVKDANAAVPKATAPENVTEEIAAYAVEQVINGGKLPNVLQRWVDNFLSAIRTAIIQNMPSGKLKNWAVMNLKAHDLARLAKAGLKAKAAGMESAQGREAMAYSTAFGKDSQHRTPLGDATEIEVDGIKRPALNSNGKPIHWSREGVENFWRWFSPSPSQLLDGLSIAEVSSLKRDTEALADFIESQSSLPESDRFSVIPPSVFAHVSGVVNNRKILDAVVRSLPVYVVNFLSGKKLSAKEVLHDSAMLENMLSVDPASNVSLGVNPSRIAELAVRVIANAGAKISGLANGALKRNSAVLADTNDPVLGAHVRKSSSGDLGIIAGFGDSKVVDAEGRPLVVYHGTAKDFTKFDLSKSGESTGNTGFYGAGAYFSEDGEDAGGYALWARKDEDDAANVIPAYLSLKDPLYLHINPKDDARKDKARASLGRIVDQLLSEGYFGKNPDKNEAGSLYSRLTTFVEKADFERFMGTLYNELKGGEGVSNLARRAGFDGVMAEGFKRGENFLAEAVAFDPTQIKSATGNTGDFGSTNPDIRYSKASQAIRSAVGAVTGAESKIVGASNRQYDQAQRQFFKNVGRDVERKNVIGRTLDYLRSDFWKKMAVGVVDQFRGLRDLGDNGQAYLLARLSKGTAGAFDALLNHGKLSLRDGVYDADKSGGFLQRLGVTLNGEIDDFLWWTAANRAEKLSKEDRENLFTPQDIAAGKSLATGTTAFDYTVQTGPLKGKVTRNRAVIYADANRVFNELQKNTLDMAEQSGLIDGSTRHLWESEFYVPFYRVSDEDGEFVGAKMGNALVRQQAFKNLKGGTDKLNADLLANTLMNWSHLIEASAKNRAAKAALTAAEKVGAAHKATYGEKNTVWYMGDITKTIPKGQTYTENGVEKVSDGTAQITYVGKVEYGVDDPFVMTAITSLEYAGMRNAVMDVMSKFKHYLTIGVTANPAFKIRNLIRDSIQAIGTSDLGYNPITNIKEGIRTTRRDSQEYVSALASGGLIRFGTMLENSEADRVRQLIKSGVKDSTILNDENKLRAFYDQYLEPAVAAYNELGNRSEEINRAALYNQLIKQGKSHAEAALLARDLMDFSLQGSFTTIRFLSQVVPFFNARLQGMYKLGRATKENPAKLATVIGACAVASIALMLGYDDDEDWKRREDFDRDGYWWFKFGGLEWRIPKPFEVGAVASLAERTLEYMINDEMTGERFRKVVSDLVKNNLSMNPVPQVIKPIIDLYANKDSFTGRPIETMNMQRLEPEMRFNSQTSMVARGLSNATAGALSPVQYDHVARAYFGWLGSFAVGMGDMAARAVSDEPEKPTADYFKLGSFGFAKEAGTGSSRYVSMIYDQAKELEQAYATYRQLVKDGKMGEAQKYMEDNKDKLSRYRSTEAVKKAESRLNEQIRLVERSNLSADEKRERINAINKQKEQVAMRLAPGLN